MNKLFLSLSLLSLSFCAACGSGSNLFNQGGGTGTGHFSNSSLKGQYAYQLSGVDLTQNPAQTIFEAGSFTADGGGKITAGVDDFALGTAVSSATLTGSYSVASDGTGTIVLTSSSGRSFSFAITLASTSKVYLVTTGTIDADNGAGIAELQSSTAFATPPSGTFVFRVHEIGSTSIARVGTINIGNGGAVTSGTEDINDGGSSSTLSLSSGLFNTPDSNGRGTGTLTDNNGTFTFAYYVVSAGSLRLFSTTSGIEGNGRAEVQSVQFSSDPISGNSYAFGSRGDDAANIGAVNTVGRFTASSGTITAGAYDAVQDSSPSTNVGFNGSYTWTPNGRIAISLSSGVQQVVWMVSSSRGFVVTIANPAVTADVEDGTMDLQQASAFSAASLKGQYAFFMDGYDAGAGLYIDRLGWIQWDGSSALSLFEFLNESGTASSAGPLAGGYAVSANGRAAASVSGIGSSNSDVVLYLISGTDAYILENDSLVEINGMMSQQVQ